MNQIFQKTCVLLIISLFFYSSFNGFPMVAKIPPSTYKICPFTKSLALDDKKIAAPAKSLGSPHFLAGVLFTIKSLNG